MGRPNDKSETRITKSDPHLTPELVEKVLMHGDLSGLTPPERLNYYKSVCNSLGLNPLTKPFDYIVLDRKLVLYARKDCTEQLRKIHGVSITELKTDKVVDVFIVTASAKDNKGRTDAATGAVAMEFIDDQGDTRAYHGTALANAIMKAETKAKRRVTLSICGLGMFDESELDTVTSPTSDDSSGNVERNVREATAHATGEVTPEPPPASKPAKPEPSNDYGPLNITVDNYKELKSHIGKAQGNMLGVKVGELHDDVIKWMYDKWREKLTPSASDQDFRLKKAIEFAYIERKRIAGDTISGGGAVTEPAGQEARERDPVKPPPDQPSSGDAMRRAVDERATKELFGEGKAPPFDLNNLTSKEACIRDLRQRIEELILTEEQACGYLHKFGLFGQGWKTFDQAPEALLLYLAQPQPWKLFKEAVEKEGKPKVVEQPKKPRATRKRR